MNVVVGIFDDARHMDSAIQHLAEHGLNDTVFDRSIIEQEAGGGLPPIMPASGVPPTPILTTTATPRRDQVFKTHLRDEFHLPSDVVENYAISFMHDDKFVIVKVEDNRLEEVMDIMRTSHASRVDQYH